MRVTRDIFNVGHWPRGLAIALILAANLMASLGIVEAQEVEQIQALAGGIEPGEVAMYLLTDLQQGQRLYIHARGTSGNLDPIVGIVKPGIDPEALETAYENALDQAISEGPDPLEVIERIRNQFMLVWDDDGGGGLTAALEIEIPADGDYRLLVAGALSFLGGETFGGYHLLIGLDAPQVLEGAGEPAGDTIAVLDVETTPPGVGVQEITGSLTQDKKSTFVELHSFKPGDTLYAYIEATSGDLIPIIVLNNFARKPIRSANLDGEDTTASLQYTFPAEGQNYQLEILSCCGDEHVTAGDYRLLLGTNAPEVLTGEAKPQGRMVAREPIEVAIGLKLEQIIEVDQQSEFFTAVASLQMEWTDPALAFNPESCQCDFQTFSGSEFNQFVADSQGRWPDFTLQNQQGKRWSQNQNVVVFANGRVIYFERFTTDFQVDFDFRQFPFDSQQFEIRVDSIFPEEFYVYTNLEGFSEISTEHGEDEFALTEIDTSITSEKTSRGADSSRFIFRFEAPRHLSYYVFRIFVPVLLIILVSWVTFFLKDYGRRIEVASANLLLFIAFSFSLADNYPRLGYMTFLDAVMALMFATQAFVVAYNVWLRRLEMDEQGELAERIDIVMDWVYPLIYLVSLAGLVWWFFWLQTA